MSIVIVGNPENRRVVEFDSAAKRFKVGAVNCISWLSFLEQPGRLAKLIDCHEDLVQVRIESPGENDKVLHEFLKLAGVAETLEHGEVGFLAEQHSGFRKALNLVDQNVSKAARRAKFFNSPADIEAMFDKWTAHKRLLAASVPRPETLAMPFSIEEFRDVRSKFGESSGRLFLKPRFASSASGVCAYRWSGDREQVIAPVELHCRGGKAKLFNSLKVRHYSRPAEVKAIIGKLLPQGMIAESWVRKARLESGRFDFRVLVVDREARHIVARQSKSPMTNLHLGNRRANLAQVIELIGEHRLDGVRKVAVQAAACFSESIYVGVDVLLPVKGRPVIGEVNAFGDLLPGLIHRQEMTYEAILAVVERGGLDAN